MKYIALLIIISILISGCSVISDLMSGPKDKAPPARTCVCPDPSMWSECSVLAIKTRTHYKCVSDTNLTCIESHEEEACEKEILFQGEKVLRARIYPTIDEEVRGVIRLEVLQTPIGTESITVLFHPEGVENQEDFTRMYDKNSNDGWMLLIDTKTFDNAVYIIDVLPTSNDAPEDNPWLDKAQAQIVVKN